MVTRQLRFHSPLAGLLLGSVFVFGCAKDSFLSGLAPTGLPAMTEPELDDAGDDETEDEDDSAKVAKKDTEE